MNCLLCTLADGSLTYFTIKENGQLTRQKRVTLGTQPTTLRKFRWVASSRRFDLWPLHNYRTSLNSSLVMLGSFQVTENLERVCVLRQTDCHLLIQSKVGLQQSQPAGSKAYVLLQL